MGIDRIVAFFSPCRLLLNYLVFLLQDLIFNGIQISMQFNTGDCEGIFAIYSKSVVSILSFLLYLLQDLIFNGNQIDFAHQQLFWTRRIAITSASASNLLQINERLINKMIFLSLSALSSYIKENNKDAFNTYHVATWAALSRSLELQQLYRLTVSKEINIKAGFIVRHARAAALDGGGCASPLQ
jgi:hypothetical protein